MAEQPNTAVKEPEAIEPLKTEAELELEKQAKAKENGSSENDPHLEHYLEITGAVIRKDGTLQWTADPEDPKSPVYIGKDIKELEENKRKGIIANNKQTRELYAKQLERPMLKSPDSRAGDDEDIPAPDQRVYVDRYFSKTGLDPEMSTWSQAQWRAFQDEHSLREFEIIQMQGRVDRLKRQADIEFSKASMDWVNEITVRDSYDNCQRMLTRSKLDPDEYGEVYENATSRILKDKDNWDKDGRLIPGRIEAELHEEITNRLFERREAEVEKKAVDRIAATRKDKDKIKSGGAGGSTIPSPTNTAKTSKEAFSILREKIARGEL